jgi:hypothetical protein
VSAISDHLPGRVERSAELTSDCDEWEPAVPVDPTIELPAFPTHCLPDWQREFVEAEAEATQTPPDMAAIFSLGAVAATVGNTVIVEPFAGWIEPLNLFVAVAMPPGERKTAVHRDTTRPIIEHERWRVEAQQSRIAEELARRDILEARLHRAERAAAGADELETRLEREQEAVELAREYAETPEPAVPRYFTSDATPEALAGLLHEHGGRMAVLSAEGGIFDLMAGRYSNGIPNLDVFLCGHSGDPIRIDRRGRAPEFIERPALTICIAVQPYVLAKAGRCAELGGRGLIDRFLYAIPPSRIGYRAIEPPPVPVPVAQRYSANVSSVAETADHLDAVRVLGLAPEASAVLTAWRTELEPLRRPTGDLGVIQGWGSKLDGATVRIAGLLHLAQHPADDWSAPIDGRTMAAAVEIARYLIPHALAAFDAMGADEQLNAARHILRWIQSKQLGSFSKRDCHRGLSSRFKRADELDRPLQILEERGWIRGRDTNDTNRPSGRPRSPSFDVHPAALRQNGRNRQNPATTKGSVSSVNSVEPDGTGTPGGEQPNHEGCCPAEGEAPLTGNPGFRQRMYDAWWREAITKTERTERLAVHNTLIRFNHSRETSGEQAVLDALEAHLTESGGYESCEQRATPCRYPGHRAHDWETADGRTVCGICHPPASREGAR